MDVTIGPPCTLYHILHFKIFNKITIVTIAEEGRGCNPLRWPAAPTLIGKNETDRSAGIPRASGSSYFIRFLYSETWSGVTCLVKWSHVLIQCGGPMKRGIMNHRTEMTGSVGRDNSSHLPYKIK